MKLNSTNFRRRRQIISIFLGVTVLAAIAAVVYGHMCVHCSQTLPLEDRVPLEANPIAVQFTQLTDSVSEWNQYAATQTLSTTTLAPVQQARVMAIIHISIHDSVNGITREYETFLAPAASPDGASADAAAIAAAAEAMRGMFGDGPFPALNNKTISQLFSESMAARGLSETDPGVGYGVAAADAVLALRASDGSAQAQFPYDGPNTDPGTWRLLPGQIAQLPGWGRVTPFALKSGSQFRPDTPPALGSDEYAKDFNEIKEIGSSTSSTRTQLQSQIALFWRASPVTIWTPVLRQVLARRSFDISATARTFALVYMAAADAGIACWDAKYVYNSWRPQSAIRRADEDGNILTEADPTWLPFIATPPHPEYPSGHSSVSSSIASVLESTLGDDGEPIVVTMSGITRQWDTFDQVVQEVIDARVFSGIHFRNSDEVGARLGRQVAQFVLTHALRRCKGRGTVCS
jgi:PAP2 superfamily